MKSKVHVLNHSLITHKLSVMRSRNTPSETFRQLLDDITTLMLYEVSHKWDVQKYAVKTPVASMQGKRLLKDTFVAVAILRAGLGMVNSILRLVPEIAVGFIGLYRDEKTLLPVQYYIKLPKISRKSKIVLVDPMLATGHSAVKAVELLKLAGATTSNIIFLSLISAPEGIQTLTESHPEITVYTACLDQKLNQKGYIVPGLGDAGDRLFKTL